jgi:hypothetical protein
MRTDRAPLRRGGDSAEDSRPGARSWALCYEISDQHPCCIWTAQHHWCLLTDQWCFSRAAEAARPGCRNGVNAVGVLSMSDTWFDPFGAVRSCSLLAPIRGRTVITSGADRGHPALLRGVFD